MTRIKICGITNIDDAHAAVEAGADALGFVFAHSPRQVSPATAGEIMRSLPPSVMTVGVFMDQTLAEVEQTVSAASVSLVQLHGRETPDFCRSVPRSVIKRVDIAGHSVVRALSQAVRAYEVAGFLLDPGAGSGRAFDRQALSGLTMASFGAVMRRKVSIAIAGGLTAQNVGNAVRHMRPDVVDVCTGVERSPGRKDTRKMIEFVCAVREADAIHVA